MAIPGPARDDQLGEQPADGQLPQAGPAEGALGLPVPLQHPTLPVEGYEGIISGLNNQAQVFLARPHRLLLRPPHPEQALAPGRGRAARSSSTWLGQIAVPRPPSSPLGLVLAAARHAGQMEYGDGRSGRIRLDPRANLEAADVGQVWTSRMIRSGCSAARRRASLRRWPLPGPRSRPRAEGQGDDVPGRGVVVHAQNGCRRCRGHVSDFWAIGTNQRRPRGAGRSASHVPGPMAPCTAPAGFLGPGYLRED